MYNLTGLEAERSILGIFKQVNSLAGDIIINIILLIIFFVIFILLRDYDPKQKLITASLITTTLAYLFYLSGLCAISIVIMPLVILIAAVFYFILS